MTIEPAADALAPIAPVQPRRSFVARHAFPILLLGLVFAAFSPVFVRLSEVGPIATAANRLIGPLPLFFFLLWLRPQDHLPFATPTGRRDFWLIVLSGVFFAGDMVFWNWSVMHTTIANATVLANIVPVFVVGAGWLLFKERVGRIFLVGMAVALTGSAIMMAQSLRMSGQGVLGDISAMAAAAFYAGYVVTLSRVRKRASLMATMAIGSTASALILLALALVAEDQVFPTTLNGWLAVAGIVFIVHVGGQMLIALSLAHVSAGLVSMMFLMQPIIPAFTAWLLFDENVTAYQVIGAVALLAGLEISRRAAAKPEVS